MTDDASAALPFKPQKIRVKKAAEIVVGQIRRAIVRGEIAPGESLPTEALLVERFAVSRPTIREAIRILESEGLLDVSRGARGGARVVPPQTALVARTIGQTLQSRGATLGDIYQARRMIEPTAVRVAAETRPEAAGKALLDHVAFERRTLDDHHSIAAAIATFHRLLVELSGNLTLTLIAEALADISEKHLTLVYRRRYTQDRTVQFERLEKAFRSHAKLGRLVRDGDAARAEAHWHAHMLAVESLWLQDLEQTGLDVLE